MSATPDALEFCPALWDLVRRGTAIGRSGDSHRCGSLSTVGNLVILRNLMLEMRPECTLEVGLSFGGSGLAFTASHRDLGHPADRQHVAIDPFQEDVWDDCGVMAIDQAGLSGYLDFRQEPSAFELPKLLAGGLRVDLAYVDGSHLIEDVFIDAYYVTRLLRDGGIVAFDDSADPHVSKVIKFLRSNCRAGLEEVDLRPYRADRGRTLRYRSARLLGRLQMTAFRRIGEMTRKLDAPFSRF